MLAILVLELAVAGYLNKYPFGGLLRQQFILFPFAVLSAGIFLDRLFAVLPGQKTAAGAAILLLGTTVAVGAVRFEAFPKLRGELFTREMQHYDAAIHSRAVFLDQFSLIVYFTHHHEWRWHFTHRLPMSTAVDDYTLERGADRLVALRDRTRWNFEFTDAAFIHDVAEVLRTSKLDTLGVFCLHQAASPRPATEQEAYRQKVFALADAEHLQIREFVPDSLNVYAEFALAPQR
jgi:hypothetical protein